MNEFKFSCPHCQQNIQATPEYSGLEINCPSCQAAIVVPQAAQAPESAAARPGKLSKAPSTVQHTATSPVMAATTIRKAKKPRIGLYVGIGVGVVVAVLAIIFAPKLVEKYQEHKETVQAAIVATNTPAPPPELTAEEILKKVDETYQGMSSYSAQAEAVGSMDMSAIPTAPKGVQTYTTSLSILMGRDGNYRFEWERQSGKKNVKAAAWSAGKGDYFRMGPAPTKMKNREMTLGRAGASSGALGMGLAELFYNKTNGLTVMLKNYSKTKNETVNGHKCYVLAGEAGRQIVTIWIHRDDFLIAKAEMAMSGKIDESMLAGMSVAQRNQMEMASKVKGSITETYDDIETNKTLSAADFQVASAPGASLKHHAKAQ